MSLPVKHHKKTMKPERHSVCDEINTANDIINFIALRKRDEGCPSEVWAEMYRIDQERLRATQKYVKTLMKTQDMCHEMSERNGLGVHYYCCRRDLPPFHGNLSSSSSSSSEVYAPTSPSHDEDEESKGELHFYCYIWILFNASFSLGSPPWSPASSSRDYDENSKGELHFYCYIWLLFNKYFPSDYDPTSPPRASLEEDEKTEVDSEEDEVIEFLPPKRRSGEEAEEGAKKRKIVIELD